ncbi:lactonase family protein [Nocardia sp. NPDC004068]|uniref:lactonase family protein n=1 Tax=Nocardia sp. NPDC004068 TaxID=3364303 RepID=UPI00368D6FBC
MRVRTLTAATVLAIGLAATGGGPTAAAPPPGVRYMLIGGTGSANIAVLRETNGHLSNTGPTVPTGVGTLSIAVAAAEHFAYVAHTVSGTLQGFRVTDSGGLIPLPDAYLAPGEPVVGAIASPDGRWLFVTVGGLTSSVETYAIGPTGGLSRVAAVPIPGATSGLSIPVVSPDGRYLFAPSFIGGTMDSFAIGADGHLTPAGPQVRTGDRPALPIVTPDGRYVYITNEGTNDISGFRIEPGGALTAIGRFPTKAVPHGMAITPDGRHMYLPQTGGPGVNGFDIHDDGSLTPLPGAEIISAPGHFPGRVVLSPDGARLYVIDTLTLEGTARVFTYLVQPDGALAPSGDPAVDTGVFFSDGATGVFTPE